MTANKGILLRWSDYFLRSGDDFHVFWQRYIQESERDILVILGVGFDPRMCLGYEALKNVKGSGKRDCMTLHYDEGSGSPSQEYSNLVKANCEKLDALVPENCRQINRKISLWSTDHRRIGSRNAAGVLSDSDLKDYTDVVIDISAMPRGIYFPLIGKALYLIDNYFNKEVSEQTLNLHVLVSENAEMDMRIKDEGIDEDANYMHFYTGTIEAESSEDLPKVWIPILGENQGQQLELMSSKVSADEVCPMIPMPSVNPRRGDNLMLEYRELLFDRLLLGPRNFIYVAEQNPFEVYRSIYRTVQHYKEAFADLGGCRVVISASSSKLLSIGALLAAYELKEQDVGVISVETQGYQLEGDIEEELQNTELFTLWLAGDCYAK